jgi:hypothetical protein
VTRMPVRVDDPAMNAWHEAAKYKVNIERPGSDTCLKQREYNLPLLLHPSVNLRQLALRDLKLPFCVAHVHRTIYSGRLR